jgi:hypothetical protein
MSKKASDQNKLDAAIWHGKPSIGSYIIIYGLFTIVLILILVTIEYVLSTSSSARNFLPASARFGEIVMPDPVEIITTIIILLFFVYKLIELVIVWATNSYDLLPDGMYFNHGIINLENTFVSPIAFSDARLIRTLPLRLAARGLIIVEANDGRHLYLRYIKDPVEVQTLIRKTLAHPTVKTN